LLNPSGQLKPEMFAMIRILTSDESASPSIPRSALIYEGESTYVWLVRTDKSIEKRRITIGVSDGNLIQVRDGLRTGDNIVTTGTLFIDRVATAAAD
jgi:cobalt-zinc-cadmium efflux system membrane fusion protein